MEDRSDCLVVGQVGPVGQVGQVGQNGENRLRDEDSGVPGSANSRMNFMIRRNPSCDFMCFPVDFSIFSLTFIIFRIYFHDADNWS